ncbi:hypothetical protein DM02DRAFT_675463 [Periconia macrospinosa]|uniref:AA1-like domain-containing protein n=1 Tax=Periconia macrospinosa TaxID=97972 RepID=A0A2V1DD32_9PLEO|nr:hypothetical protein DM02DRAFT_675463 [Periconia macrospinosa]
MAFIKTTATALLLASSAFAIDVPAVPTWPSGRCTDKSLTIPSWIISRYEVANGVASFRITNRASDPSGLYADATCSPGKPKCSLSSGGESMSATLTTGSNGQPVVTVTDFWVCGDEGARVNFRARGNTTITACEGTDCTSAIDYLAPGTLELPVPVTPTQPKAPQGVDAPSCANVGEKQWTVDSVAYKKFAKTQCKRWYIEDQVCLDPNYDWISRGEYLSLRVKNNGISHEVTCNFKAEYGKENLPQPWRCTGGNYGEIILDLTWTGTAPNFNLKVEELWYCIENPKENSNVTALIATGSTDLKLACETTTGITGTPDDLITSCKDTASHELAGSQKSKSTLPAFSLVTAWPAHGGCTFDSVKSPTFGFRGMRYWYYPNLTYHHYAAGVLGPNFEYWIYDSGAPIRGSGEDAVYNCNSYYDGKPRDQHYKCEISIHAKEQTAWLAKAWECRDKNQNEPLYFEGSGDFDWSLYPQYNCGPGGVGYEGTTACTWRGATNTAPGIPYAIPKVTVGRANVLPPDYGPPGVQSAPDMVALTVFENNEWKVAEQNVI